MVSAILGIQFIVWPYLLYWTLDDETMGAFCLHRTLRHQSDSDAGDGELECFCNFAAGDSDRDWIQIFDKNEMTLLSNQSLERTPLGSSVCMGASCMVSLSSRR